jgi:hypothetical protein
MLQCDSQRLREYFVQNLDLLISYVQTLLQILLEHLQ